MQSVFVEKNFDTQPEIISKFKKFFYFYDLIYARVIEGDISYIKSMLISFNYISNKCQLDSIRNTEYDVSILQIKESLEYWIKERRDFDQNIMKNIEKHICNIEIESYTNEYIYC